MAQLSTKAIVIPDAKDERIIKNEGYFSVHLVETNYNSSANFYQKLFDGTSKVTLCVELTYSGSQEKSVQDVRIIKAKERSSFSHDHALTVNLPAKADFLKVVVNLYYDRKDNLQSVLDFLNQDEFRPILSLVNPVAPSVVKISSIITAATRVANNLDISYTGGGKITPLGTSDQEGLLKRGYLAIVSMDSREGTDLPNNFDESLFSVTDSNTLQYNSKDVTNTYILFRINTQKRLGADEDSAWFKKYNESYGILQRLVLPSSNDNKIKNGIIEDARLCLFGAKCLLDEDPRYVDAERNEINENKQTQFDKLLTKYIDNKPIIMDQIKVSMSSIMSNLRPSLMPDNLSHTQSVIKEITDYGAETKLDENFFGSLQSDKKDELLVAYLKDLDSIEVDIV